MQQIDPQPLFTALLNLASEKLGAKVIACSDDFFAGKENLIKEGRGISIPDKYTERGKWMDGWESRRKRVPGHDWCIIKLGAPGVIKGFDIDTNHFLGNHPPHASIDACRVPAGYEERELNNAELTWVEVLPKSSLQPGSQNFFETSNNEVVSHIRLNIYPDGGVARLKIYGEVFKNWDEIKTDEIIDLASALNGAKSIQCNDMFFSHMDNLLMPGRGTNMGDGWETKRNRTPGNRDWVIIRLGHKGRLKKIVVDTRHFKGNYPESCSLEGCSLSIEEEKNIGSENIAWTEVLPQQKLTADFEHEFTKEVVADKPITHVRLFIYPDGGISRIRLYGTIV